MEFWRYDLSMEFPPNARTPSGVIEGALIREGGGYGCLQAWPSLGDLPLEGQLQALRDGTPTALGEACLLCCEIDAAARRDGRDLFDGVELPPSHLLVDRLDDDTLRRAAEVGLVKVKRPELVAPLAQVARVRIDFNCGLDAAGFGNFVDSLDAATRERIDFVEDPTPYDPRLWEALQAESGLSLALDRGPNDARQGFAVRVWKPACVAEPPAGELFCITHNMDHELGRRYAAYRAASFGGDLVACGLVGGALGEGTGLGLDDWLENLSWREL